MHEVIQRMRQAREEFWAHHPELWDDRRKIQVEMHRQPDGSFVAKHRWKDRADRKRDRGFWLERKLFPHCMCSSCPDRSWHGEMIMKVAKKLRII